MPVHSTDLYVRTCQECGKRQESKPCIEYKGESWRDKLCKYCKSPGLDYGSFGWSRASDGTFYKESNPDEPTTGDNDNDNDNDDDDDWYSDPVERSED